MNIALIGTIVKDTLRMPDGPTKTGLGGLTHSLNALASLAGRDKIVPVSFVGADIVDTVRDVYKDVAAISLDYLVPITAPNNAVEVQYINSNERRERSLNPMPPLSREHMIGLLRKKFDLIIVNMISGWDIELSALDYLRRYHQGPIAIDLHSLCLQRLRDGRRTAVDKLDARPWIELCDIVQLNEREARIVSADSPDWQNFCSYYCGHYGKIINLTLGPEGSRSYFSEAGVLKTIHSKPPRGIRVTDPTGCGDNYLASFAYVYIKTGSIKEAARMANLNAALSGTCHGLAPIEGLREMRLEY